ncbi:MAG: Nramp family divalent metal transporter [Myxococcota bacterium]
MTTGVHDDEVPLPPRGSQRWKQMGPGFIWMLSATGSGELLLTPRVGALYGYQLLWALVLAVVFKWFINREIGRYTVCTGSSIVEGFAQLPGPKNWALWVILAPQLLVVVPAIAGLAGMSASALALFVPGDAKAWMAALTVACAVLIVLGRYQKLEKGATLLATALALASIVAAFIVQPEPARLAAGALPTVPEKVRFDEVIPWLGFALSGAAGLLWYSYWVKVKGFGAAAIDTRRPPSELSEGDRARLAGWVRHMTMDCTLAVVGTLVVTLAFLVLGTELLRPRRLVPEEDRVVEILGRLLGDVWGPVGFWGMVVGLFVAFWATLLSNQDGHGRLYGNGTHLILKSFGVDRRWARESALRKGYVVVLVTALPILIFVLVGNPVSLLKVAGSIEAIHIPVIAVLALLVNRRLPRGLAPSRFATVATSLGALFFAMFAVLYLLGLVT